ncbi:MAG: hypothetical protein E5Y88_15995 [Mesorhizobium sp.]|nr:hypothetical protein EOD08_18140 [Mesorhizobium sp. M6A.T.Ca.TU.002.02.2.1]RVB76645.1 hypothetical protein EN885_15890 [Mesorhizobium sp. M6A.T.Cr.TU.014.01.1.1]RWO94603.1 MAG: hypothetical protein EOQ98_29835 [Mesorhizobium sp.]RWP47149.1 MAG: hypothetical protein EOR05_19060 [Mesorhizobium sp.]RWP71935.1 MAG: hypothetical protein EOR10_28715 [Mesorhizobium sp.]
MTPVRGAPLWPAGHLPHTGGDWMHARLSPIANGEDGSAAMKLPISPQVGEMSGRTEGGATEHDGPDVRSSSRRHRIGTS